MSTTTSDWVSIRSDVPNTWCQGTCGSHPNSNGCSGPGAVCAQNPSLPVHPWVSIRPDVPDNWCRDVCTGSPFAPACTGTGAVCQQGPVVHPTWTSIRSDVPDAWCNSVCGINDSAHGCSGPSAICVRGGGEETSTPCVDEALHAEVQKQESLRTQLISLFRVVSCQLPSSPDPLQQRQLHRSGPQRVIETSLPCLVIQGYLERLKAYNLLLANTLSPACMTTPVWKLLTLAD